MKEFINPLDDLIRYSLDDKGIGNAFADSVKNELRYVADDKSWYYYDDICWKKDYANLKARELAKEYHDFLKEEAEAIQPAETREEQIIQDLFVDFVQSLSKNGARKKMLDDAMSVHPLHKADFDAHPNLLNCLDCTIDLDTFEALEHDPDHLLTKVAQVNYDKEIDCARWDKFIQEIMCGDVEAARYLQKAYGYGLIGVTSQECLFINYGPSTRNGKGTLMESILNVTGDYSLNMQPDSLAKRTRYSGSVATPDIARNAGVRIVSVNEPPEDMVLDAAIVKQLTGSDTITSRFLYGNSFDYRPQFTLYISTNHLPVVTDDTLFSSGRIKVIPFNRHFAENEQDSSLKSLFRTKEYKSAILNWLLEGLRMYKEEGLNTPQAIINATDIYRRTTDTVSTFIKSAVHNNPKAKARKTSDAYEMYTKWCEESNMTAVDLKRFIGVMRKLGFVKRDGKQGNVVYGIDIKLNGSK